MDPAMERTCAAGAVTSNRRGGDVQSQGHAYHNGLQWVEANFGQISHMHPAARAARSMYAVRGRKDETWRRDKAHMCGGGGGVGRARIKTSGGADGEDSRSATTLF